MSWDIETSDVTTYAAITNRTLPSDCFAQDITDVVEPGHTYEYRFYAMLSDDYEGAPANQRQVDFAPYIVSGGSTTYLGSYSAKLSGSCSQQLTPGRHSLICSAFSSTGTAKTFDAIESPRPAISPMAATIITANKIGFIPLPP